MPRYNKPPSLPGIPEAHSYGDAWRISCWMLRGFIHGITRGPFGSRVVSSVLTVLHLVLFIPMTVIVWGMILRRSARYYMSPERNAVLAIVAKRGAWHIANHVAAEPGHHQGKALRKRLIGPLTIAADRAGVEIRTVAANQKLAEQYVAEVQGLVDVGPGMPRGRKLQRPPAQDARTNLQ